MDIRREIAGDFCEYVVSDAARRGVRFYCASVAEDSNHLNGYAVLIAAPDGHVFAVHNEDEYEHMMRRLESVR